MTNFVIYLLSFVGIWYGAGLIVSSADRIAHRLRLSSFAISFFILGVLTSIPEFAVGLTGVAQNRPAIFAGNLLGGVAIIFLLIIPLLAILGKGLELKHNISRKNLILALLVIAAPAVSLVDGTVSAIRGVIIIGLYVLLFYFIERSKGVLDNHNKQLLQLKAYAFTDILKVIAGVTLVFIASQQIVEKTLFFSQVLNIPTFFLSLILVSLGTNLPELSLSVRAVLSGKTDIAFGDYVGSAAANSLLFGIFSVLTGEQPVAIPSYWTVLIFIVVALVLFYRFGQSRQSISKKEAQILLGLYVAFVAVELLVPQLLSSTGPSGEP